MSLLHHHWAGAFLMSAMHTLTIWCLQWGWTPLHEAARYGHLEVAQLLLSCPGVNVHARNKVNALEPWPTHGLFGLVLVHGALQLAGMWQDSLV
jgi:Ankyrin repeat